jgi:hypothetical protein
MPQKLPTPKPPWTGRSPLLGKAASMPTQELVHPEHYLEVGLTQDERQVIINHPDLQVDEHGCGHIIFSPSQAIHLAKLLLRKANECKP